MTFLLQALQERIHSQSPVRAGDIGRYQEAAVTTSSPMSTTTPSTEPTSQCDSYQLEFIL